MKEIKMEIKAEDLLNMLSKYYSELLNEEVKVESRLDSVWRGYGMDEYQETVVILSYTIEHKIEGSVLRVKNTLDYEDVKRALNAILAKLGYTVEDFAFKTSTSGYGRDEMEFFEGIEARVTKKGMEMKLEQ